MLAAMKTGRNSVGVEVDPFYCRMAHKRLEAEGKSLFEKCRVVMVSAEEIQAAGRRYAEASK
jgi:site-specific DNA-methyltransferase (adenine-specific)